MPDIQPDALLSCVTHAYMLAGELTHPPIHDVRPQDILDSLSDLSAFMDKSVLENQRRTRLTLHGQRLEARGASLVPAIEIDHECKQAQFAVLPGEGRIGVPREPLTRSVAVESKTLVEAPSLAAKAH